MITSEDLSHIINNIICDESLSEINKQNILLYIKSFIPLEFNEYIIFIDQMLSLPKKN